MSDEMIIVPSYSHLLILRLSFSLLTLLLYFPCIATKMCSVLGILLVCTALRFLSFFPFIFLINFLNFNTVLSLCRAISSAVFAKEKEKRKKKASGDVITIPVLQCFRICVVTEM